MMEWQLNLFVQLLPVRLNPKALVLQASQPFKLLLITTSLYKI